MAKLACFFEINKAVFTSLQPFRNRGNATSVQNYSEASSNWTCTWLNMKWRSPSFVMNVKWCIAFLNNLNYIWRFTSGGKVLRTKNNSLYHWLWLWFSLATKWLFKITLDYLCKCFIAECIVTQCFYSLRLLLAYFYVYYFVSPIRRFFWNIAFSSSNKLLLEQNVTINNNL